MRKNIRDRDSIIGKEYNMRQAGESLFGLQKHRILPMAGGIVVCGALVGPMFRIACGGVRVAVV